MEVKKRLLPKLTPTLFCYFVILGALLSCDFCWAGIGDTSGGGDTDNRYSCTSVGATWRTDLCGTGRYGGGSAWYVYKADSDDISISGYQGYPGGAIKNCASEGGFYVRHAIVETKTATPRGLVNGGLWGNSDYAPWVYNSYGQNDLPINGGTINVKELQQWDGIKISWNAARQLFAAMQKSPKFSYQTTGYWINNSTSNFAWFCFDPGVFSNFRTQPSAKINDESVVYSGSATTANIKVQVSEKDNENSFGGSATPEDTIIQAVEFYLSPGADSTLTSGATAISSDPCTFFTNKYGANLSHCEQIISRNEALQQGIESFTANITSTILDNGTIGSKYCIAIGVKPSTSDESNSAEYTWTISAASCRTIAKKPTVQVKDGSVYSAAGIKTSISKKTSGTFGSWVEYLAIAGSGEIKNFSSGAYLSSGNQEKTSDPCVISPLTIANNECESNTLGESGISPSNTFTEQLITQYSNQKLDGDGILSGDDAITDTIVVYYSGNVSIAGNYSIADNATVTDPAKIPQLIIIAENGNINIAPSVTRIDAILVAPEGTVDTCSSTDIPSSEECTNQLTIRGAIYAKNLKLDRTAGMNNTKTSTTPAEIIQQTPLIYLWARAQQTSSSNIQANTVYTKELAPRL